MDEFIKLALKGLEVAVKYAPGIAAEIRKLFSGPPPTAADWQALHDKIASKSYQDYVPDSAIPKTDEEHGEAAVPFKYRPMTFVAPPKV